MSSITRPTGWDRVLLVVIAGVIAYAVGLIVAGLFLGDRIFDPLGFGPDDGDIAAGKPRDYLQLVYGILGAVIVGWMITIGAIVGGPLRRREAWAWQAIVAAVTMWFVLDTGLSLVPRRRVAYRSTCDNYVLSSCDRKGTKVGIGPAIGSGARPRGCWGGWAGLAVPATYPDVNRHRCGYDSRVSTVVAEPTPDRRSVDQIQRGFRTSRRAPGCNAIGMETT